MKMDRRTDLVNARAAALLLAVFAPGCQGPAPAAKAAAVHGPALVGTAAPHRALAAIAGSHATSFDERGVPTFLLATGRQAPPPGANVEAAARFHLARHLAALDLPPDALEAAEVVHVRDPGAGGVPGGIVVRLQQRLGGIEVHRGEIRLLMGHDLRLVALAGRLQAVTAAPRPDQHPFRLSPEEAMAGALSHAVGGPVSATDLNEETDPTVPTASTAPTGPMAGVVEAAGGEGRWRRYRLAEGAPGLRLPEPARAKKVYFLEGDRLIAAYVVEFYAGAAGDVDSSAWRYVVAADDGRVLERQDLTAYDAFNFRVFAEAGGDKRPFDGPVQDFTPHPTGRPDGSMPGFVAPNLVSMDAFNHNPAGQGDPWLAADATNSRGNNVDAYTDRSPPDGFSAGDLRATTTSALTFDRVYDFGSAPTASNDQAMAGVTELFYVTNWLHDWYYDSGFNEAAGNAQRDNFGRGGVGGDAMRAEAQDNVLSGARNNSNMSTPSDGMSPRMQIFVWNGPETRRLTITPPGGDVPLGIAYFGPPAFDVTGEVTLVNDGKGTTSDGCEPIPNVSGRIALVDRGNCLYKQKVVNAEAGGALGVIVVDNQMSATPPVLTDGAPMGAVKIAPMSVTQAEGAAIKTALGQGAVTARMLRKRAPDRDGTLENTVTAHEWGHYLHHRLADCVMPQCAAMSEGWGDFVALHMLLHEGDDLDGTYAFGIYAGAYQGDSGYFGLRRQPYSVDLAKDGLTFRHIAAGEPLPNQPHQLNGAPNFEVHNAGEVWASMLFEAYVALQKAAKAQTPPIPFDEVRRRMSDYVVTSLQLTPQDATYTEARDALFAAAAAAHNQEDVLTLAQAFARRGAGSCATSPARESNDFRGVVESMDVKPRVDIGEVTLDDSVRSCDGDGQLDAGERGKLTITISNGGPVPLAGARVTVASTSPGLRFPGGVGFDLPEVGPFGSTQLAIDVELDGSVAGIVPLEFNLDVQSPAACAPRVSRQLIFRGNFDDRPASSRLDDVESAQPVWEPSGDEADRVWARDDIGSLAHAWHGRDYGSFSDTWLESPDLKVSATAPLVIRFDHRYRFEAATERGTRVFYDGAVIEISDDGGAWEDIADWADPGYGGRITDVSGNPLAHRNALVDHNPAWPDWDKVTLDLGTALAGKTVRLRFRIGSDQAAGEVGWYIDNINSQGIDNTPFASLVMDARKCGPMLAADAGAGGGPEAPMLADRGCSCAIARRGSATGPLAPLVLAAIALVAGWRHRRRRRPDATSSSA